jgi:hypothetical protein
MKTSQDNVELFPYESFGVRLEHLNEKRICWFKDDYELQKYLERYKLDKRTIKLIIVMENPLTPVKNVREVWNKNLNRKVKEVQVQVKDEPPAWIPLETLLALQNVRKNDGTN